MKLICREEGYLLKALHQTSMTAFAFSRSDGLILGEGALERRGTAFSALWNSVISYTATLASLAFFAFDARQVGYFSSA